MSRPVAFLAMLLVPMLWGFAFVAQKTAMDGIGPLTFIGVRYALGTLAILPLVLWELRRTRVRPAPRDLWLVALICAAFFIGVWLQQLGITMTTVTNSGFLTSLYVLLVPLLAIIVRIQRPHPILWPAAGMAVLGVFLLNGGQLDGLNAGDLLVIASTLAWAVQVLLIGIVSRRTGLPVTISALCFLSTAIAGSVGAFAVETPEFDAILGSWVEILYAGVLSTAVAFTLQAVAQQYVPPANAAIILSSEGLFAAIGGALLLGERLLAIGYFGAALIMLAIVLVEALPALAARRREVLSRGRPTPPG